MNLVQRTLTENCTEVQSNGFEHCGPEIIHVPGNVLIYQSSLFHGLSPQIRNTGV